MDDRLKTIIRKSRTLFVKTLEDISGVCDKLIELGTLTSNMYEEVMSETTRESKIRKLLDILPRRGSTAFGCFHQALVDTGNQELADLLRPELAGKSMSLSLNIPRKKSPLTRSLSTPSPSTPPTKQFGLLKYHSVDELETTPEVSPEYLVPGWPESVVHNPLDIKIKPPRQKYNSNVYPMNRMNGNVIIVIGHDNSQAQSTRELTDRLNLDASSLQLLFKSLNFHVKTHWNVTIKKLTEIVTKESTSDHSENDSLIFIIMSKGKGDIIVGAEGQTLKLDNLMSCFDVSHCPSLEGKPKIFMVQSFENHEYRTVSQRSGPLSDDVIGDESLGSMVSDVTEQSMTNARSDMFIARSTVDKPMEFQGSFGSYFIQAFVYIMTHAAHKEDIETIFQKMNTLARSGQHFPEMDRILEYSSSLTKKFYFSLDTSV